MHQRFEEAHFFPFVLYVFIKDLDVSQIMKLGDFAKEAEQIIIDNFLQ